MRLELPPNAVVRDCFDAHGDAELNVAEILPKWQPGNWGIHDRNIAGTLPEFRNSPKEAGNAG